MTIVNNDFRIGPNQPIDISVLIVNWNAHALIEQCLISLEKNTEVTLEVIVVDNASTDGSVEKISTRFPNIIIVANHENRGFAAANNQAAEVAQGKYLLLLNPDTKVPPGTLRQLVNYVERHWDAGAIGPRLLNPDGTLQRSCWRGYPGLLAALVDAFYLWKIPWLPLTRVSEYTSLELQATLEVDHILGACMFLRRQVWDDVGPLNENYFLFLEETDWCRRAKNRGWRIMYYPDVSIIHFGQHSMRQQPSKNLPYLYRNYCRFYRESSNSTQLGLASLKVIIAIAVMIRFVVWTARRVLAHKQPQKAEARSMLSGYRQVMRELRSF